MPLQARSSCAVRATSCQCRSTNSSVGPLGPRMLVSITAGPGLSSSLVRNWIPILPAVSLSKERVRGCPSSSARLSTSWTVLPLVPMEMTAFASKSRFVNRAIRSTKTFGLSSAVPVNVSPLSINTESNTLRRPRTAQIRTASSTVVLPTPFLPVSSVTRPRRGIVSSSMRRKFLMTRLGGVGFGLASVPTWCSPDGCSAMAAICGCGFPI